MQDERHFRVVGVSDDGTRDVRYKNLSLETAERVLIGIVISRKYRDVFVEDQDNDRRVETV